MTPVLTMELQLLSEWSDSCFQDAVSRAQGVPTGVCLGVVAVWVVTERLIWVGGWGADWGMMAVWARGKFGLVIKHSARNREGGYDTCWSELEGAILFC